MVLIRDKVECCFRQVLLSHVSDAAMAIFTCLMVITDLILKILLPMEVYTVLAAVFRTTLDVIWGLYVKIRLAVSILLMKAGLPFLQANTSCQGINENNEQDDIEFQELGEDNNEKSSSLAWKKCDKHPGHKGFIPIRDFGLQHLPQRFQREDVLEYIKLLADLTVRLRVKVSSQRPKNNPFAKYAGKTISGTARVGNVGELEKDCFCTECKANGYKNRKWWYVDLVSATHCVFDEEEANSVEVNFFYDTDESLQNGEVKTVCGVRMLGAFRTEDNCTMSCATHDEELGRILQQRFKQSINTYSRMHSKPIRRSSTTQKKVMVCVSHPHGAPKHVTVGELIHQHDVTYNDPTIGLIKSLYKSVLGICNVVSEYTTGTCPGSSGAEVRCLDDMASGDMAQHSSSYFIHMRRDLKTGLNIGFGRRIESGEHYVEWITNANRGLSEMFQWVIGHREHASAWVD